MSRPSYGFNSSDTAAPSENPGSGRPIYLHGRRGALLAKRQMRQTIPDTDCSPSSNKLKQAVSGIHPHVLSHVPEDGDVFHGLKRKSSIPEHIGTMDQKNLGDPDRRKNFAGKLSSEAG
jgi:hypothetical protein